MASIAGNDMENVVDALGLGFALLGTSQGAEACIA